MQSDVLQELLPARAHEQGLTPALLQEYLHRLETRQSEVLQHVYERAAQHYSQPLPAGDPDAAAAAAEVDDVARGLPDAEAAQLAAQHADLGGRLAALQEQIAVAAAVADLQARLDDFDAQVAAGSYSNAAWAARQVEREAAEAAESGLELNEAVAAQHAAFAERQASLLQTAEEALEQGLWADAASGQLWAAQRLGPAGTSPAEVWTALAALGARPRRLAWLSDLLLSQTLLPMLGEPPGAPPAVQYGDGDATLTWRVAPDAEAEGTSLEACLLAVLQFVAGSILQDDTEAAQELGTLLWPRLAAKYVEKCLAPHPPADGTKGEAFQTAAAAATAFENEAAAAGWVPGAQPGGGEAVGGRLHSYIKHALNRYLHAKRLRVVSEARELMRGDATEAQQLAGAPLPADEARQAAAAAEWVDAARRFQMRLQLRSPEDEEGTAMEDFADGDAGGVDVYAGGSPDGLQHLSVGQYRVTRRGAGLAALVREALGEAAASGSPAVAGLMAGAVRDIAALLTAPPPPSDRAQLQVPQLAALRHNDAWHLASVLAAAPATHPQLAALSADGGQQQNGGAPAAAGGPVAVPSSGPASAPATQPAGILRSAASSGSGRLFAVSLDFDGDASALRGAASATLSALINAQAAQLAELLAGADHFRKVQVAQRGITARKVVSQLLAALRRAGGVLAGVLPPAAHVAVASALLQSTLSAIIGDILAMRDIGVEESEELPQILHTLVDDGAAAATGPLQPEPARQLVLQAVRDATPALLQLQVLLEVLNARLADIREWWVTGALETRGFGAPQVAHLVRALFEPTEMRAQLLDEIGG